jgi:mannosyltransferase
MQSCKLGENAKKRSVIFRETCGRSVQLLFDSREEFCVRGIRATSAGQATSLTPDKYAGLRSDQAGISPRFIVLILALITIAGLVLRFYRLGEWSFWIDEVYTLRDVRLFLADPSYPRPLSLILTSGLLQWIGFQDGTARVVPAVIGGLTIPVLFLLGNRLFGPMVGLTAAAILALAPWHLFWSQNARFYTALMLFYALGTLCFHFWLENQKHVYLLLSGAFLFLAVQERLTALIAGPVIVAYLLLLLIWPFDKPAGFNRRNYTILAILGLLLVVHQIYLVATGTWGELIDIFVGYSRDPVRVFLAIINDVGIPLFLFGLAGGIFLTLKGNRTGFYLLVGGAVPVLMLLAIAPFVQVTSRYVLVCLPNWIILAAVAVSELIYRTERESRWLAIGLMLVLPASLLADDYLYFKFQHGNRLNWQAAFSEVKQAGGDADIVVSTRPPLGEHYLAQKVLGTEVDLGGIEKAGRSAWFVIDYDTSGDVPPNLTSWLARKTVLKAVHDTYLPGKPMRLRVYHYDAQTKPE